MCESFLCHHFSTWWSHISFRLHGHWISTVCWWLRVKLTSLYKSGKWLKYCLVMVQAPNHTHSSLQLCAYCLQRLMQMYVQCMSLQSTSFEDIFNIITPKKTAEVALSVFTKAACGHCTAKVLFMLFALRSSRKCAAYLAAGLFLTRNKESSEVTCLKASIMKFWRWARAVEGDWVQMQPEDTDLRFHYARGYNWKQILNQTMTHRPIFHLFKQQMRHAVVNAHSNTLTATHQAESCSQTHDGGSYGFSNQKDAVRYSHSQRQTEREEKK